VGIWNYAYFSIEKVDGYQINNESLTRAIVAQLGCKPSDVFITEFSSKPGSKIGENFTCILFAVEVKAQIKGRYETFHFMVKCLPASEVRAKFITDVSIFLA
jgi:hypothetical protein